MDFLCVIDLPVWMLHLLNEIVLSLIMVWRVLRYRARRKYSDGRIAHSPRAILCWEIYAILYLLYDDENLASLRFF